MKIMRLAVAVVLAGLAVVGGMIQVRAKSGAMLQEVPPLNLPLVAPEAVLETGTFFMATYAAEGNPVPWPFNPLASLDVPVYWLQGSSYLVDDRIVGSVDQALAAMHLLNLAAQGKSLDESPSAERSSGPPPPPPAISTNDLWLELFDDDFTNGFALLTLHNTVEGDGFRPYQLEIRTNLTVPDEWLPGQIVFGAPGTNRTDFTNVPLDTNEQMYFRAHYADAVIAIQVVQTNAYEPHVGFVDEWGKFTLTSTGTNDLTVLYRLSGVASNGVDYTNLTGVVTVPASPGQAEVLVQPIADGVFEFPESVTLTLIPHPTYLIDTNSSPATVFIHDDPSTTVSVVAGNPNAVEPDATSNVPGQEGFFALTREDTHLQFPSMTVNFVISGVASNGVDYTNISGSVTLAVDQQSTNLFVQPVEDGLLEGDETVRLTLSYSTNYIREKHASEADILIEEHATNIFVTVVANLDYPIGIDYLAVSNALVASHNFYNIGATTGAWPNFVRIYTNLVSSNVVTVTTNWSTISNVASEVKLVIVNTNASGFTNGDMYFGSDNGIGWLSAKGNTNNLNWCVLTNATVTNTMLIRGSICQDHTSIFSNQLIAVTSGGQEGNTRDVWRVDAQAHPTLIAQIETSHLEGVITLPNDANKWGPWGGKIITGDEELDSPFIYTISPSGVVSTNDTTILFPPDGIHPEDFDIIPPNQDLYACDPVDIPGEGKIVKLSASYLTNYVGDLLITDAGEHGPLQTRGARLFILHWDSGLNNFVVRSISYRRVSDGNLGHFEHVTFAPIHLPPL